MHNRNYLLLLAMVLLATVQSNAQQFSFSAERPTSCAAADGIITIVPTRGVPPFTYQWSTGATSISLKNITKGTYSATLTDASGATITHSYILNSVELDLELSDSRPSSTCNPNSGLLTVSPTGGTAPYTYTWSDGQTGPTAQGLTIGDYSVTVQDAAGCVAEGVFTVSVPTYPYQPTAQITTISEPDCNNQTNGELDAQMMYSQYAPFSFTWSTGATGQSLTALASGTYSVTITDALGCTAASTVGLRKKLTMTGSVVCTGDNTGTASALLVNAASPVTYNWNNGQTGASLTGLINGTYQVTATDANGCSSIGAAFVKVPVVVTGNSSPVCFSGNNGVAYSWVNNDQALSFTWDNGVTDSWNNTLSPGAHTVTVTTALGCSIVGNVNIPTPIAPPFTFSANPSPADCLNGVGGALNLTISGGIAPYTFYAYGPTGFVTSDIASLQNLQAGEYFISASSTGQSCWAQTTVNVPDAGGFEPKLQIVPIDCVTGFGSAEVTDVTTSGAQFQWSNGATTPNIFNLTEGSYSVTVSAAGSCQRFFNFYLESGDSLQMGCGSVATGKLINDLGNPGCTGTTGIPFQLIRTLPSGALQFTDADGVYAAHLPDNGTFQLETAHYDPADIACPATGQYTVNATPGNTVSNLDFHFLNNNPIDHRVVQKPLRTAQPGYPYSTRFKVCNDGSTSNAGTLTLEYGNFLGSVSGVSFAQHAASFSLLSEVAGIPNNTATFSFPGIAPGACELLQVDFTTPTTTPLNSAFISTATVSPASGDPTPDNNVANLYNTVVGSFDPNSVLAYPARNGNPHDGGEISRLDDKTIQYQIFFQNTGSAPADLVIVRDTLDANLDAASIRNIAASHNVKVSLEGDNQVLVFQFANISLPDSTSDYAGSIGSIQYEIDVKPDMTVGTQIEKHAAIFFDFNPPVITNQNVLTVADLTSVAQAKPADALVVSPNPADVAFHFYSRSAGELSLFNALGDVVSTRKIEKGLQEVNTAGLPNGVYLVKLMANGTISSGKVVVSH